MSPCDHHVTRSSRSQITQNHAWHRDARHSSRSVTLRIARHHATLSHSDLHGPVPSCCPTSRMQHYTVARSDPGRHGRLARGRVEAACGRDAPHERSCHGWVCGSAGARSRAGGRADAGRLRGSTLIERASTMAIGNLQHSCRRPDAPPRARCHGSYHDDHCTRSTSIDAREGR